MTSVKYTNSTSMTQHARSSMHFHTGDFIIIIFCHANKWFCRIPKDFLFTNYMLYQRHTLCCALPF